jgi:hypothetical protein
MQLIILNRGLVDRNERELVNITRQGRSGVYHVLILVNVDGYVISRIERNPV